MSESEESSNTLIKPQHLVMFSEKTRKHIEKTEFNYLSNDYDVQYPDYDNDPKYRVWGLPFYSIGEPKFLGAIAGISFGSMLNYLTNRKLYAKLHNHIGFGLFAGLSMHLYYKYREQIVFEREIVIWDYVKKHPEDFPEVFNKPKKYADLFMSWKRNI